MARTGYSTTVDNNTTGATATLRGYLNSNLTTWSTGAVQTFGSGTTQRDYYVLSHNTSNAEILVVQPDPVGNASDINSCVLAAYRPLSAMLSGVVLTDDIILAFAFSPGGGYAARFVAGDDPSTDATFWPSDSSLVFPAQWYEETTSPDIDLVFLEESAHAELTIYSAKVSPSNTGWGMISMSAAMYTATPGSTYGTAGMWHLETTSGTGTPRPEAESNFTLYDAGTPETAQWNPAGGGLTGLVATNQPATDGTYLTRRLAVASADLQTLPCILNPALALECGRMTATYGTRIGPGTQPYVHLTQDFFTPWANGLAAPNV